MIFCQAQHGSCTVSTGSTFTIPRWQEMKACIDRWHFWPLRFGEKQKAGTSTQHHASTHLAEHEMHDPQHERLHHDVSIDAGRMRSMHLLPAHQNHISLLHTSTLLPTCNRRHVHQISNTFPRKTAPPAFISPLGVWLSASPSWGQPSEYIPIYRGPSRHFLASFGAMRPSRDSLQQSSADLCVSTQSFEDKTLDNTSPE